MLDEIERVSHPENEDFGFEIYLWGANDDELFNDGHYEPGTKNNYRRFIANLADNDTSKNHSPYVDEYHTKTRSMIDEDPISSPSRKSESREILKKKPVNGADTKKLKEGWLSFLRGVYLSEALESSETNDQAYLLGFSLNNDMGKPDGYPNPPNVVSVSDQETVEGIFNYVRQNPEDYYEVIEAIADGFETPKFNERMLEPSEPSGTIHSLDTESKDYEVLNY